MTIKRSTGCMNNQRFVQHWLVLGVFAICLWLPTQVFAAAAVNIYSHRQQVLIQPFLDAFTKATGIETKTVYAAKG